MSSGNEKLKNDEVNLGFQDWDTLSEVPFNGSTVESLEQERKKVALKDLEPILSKENTVIFGHGTGRNADTKTVVEKIFKQGLRGYRSEGSLLGGNREEVLGSTDLEGTAIGLAANMGEERVDLDDLTDRLDNWQHLDSKNIILLRLPIEYMHMMTGFSEERYEPFFVQKEDDDGRMCNFVDSRFVLGNYDATTGMVELNPNFENEMSDDFKQEMQERLERAQKSTEERNKKIEEEELFGPVGNTSSENTTPNVPPLGNFDWDSADWNNADWDDEGGDF